MAKFFLALIAIALATLICWPTLSADENGLAVGEFWVEDPLFILVIEDDQAIQRLVEEALGESGFEPAIATSGDEAVTLLKGAKPDTSPS
jgi:PleD family two-component response regulator